MAIRKSLYNSNEIYADKLTDQRIFNRFFKLDELKKNLASNEILLQNTSNTKYASNNDLIAANRMIKSSNSNLKTPNISKTQKRLLQRSNSKVELPILLDTNKTPIVSQTINRKNSATNRKNRFGNSKIIYLSQSTTDLSKDSKENSNGNKKQSIINEDIHDIKNKQPIEEQIIEEQFDCEYLAEINRKCLKWLEKCTYYDEEDLKYADNYDNQIPIDS